MERYRKICEDHDTNVYCQCKYLKDLREAEGHWLMMQELQEKIRIKKLDPKVVQLEYEEEADAEELPSECVICMEPFVLPVVTICKHYFCRPCAVQHYDKDEGCFICSKLTRGKFRNAHKLRDRIAAHQEI